MLMATEEHGKIKSIHQSITRASSVVGRSQLIANTGIKPVNLVTWGDAVLSSASATHLAMVFVSDGNVQTF